MNLSYGYRMGVGEGAAVFKYCIFRFVRLLSAPEVEED